MICLLIVGLQAFIHTAQKIYEHIQNGVYDVSNDSFGIKVTGPMLLATVLESRLTGPNVTKGITQSALNFCFGVSLLLWFFSYLSSGSLNYRNFKFINYVVSSYYCLFVVNSSSSIKLFLVTIVYLLHMPLCGVQRKGNHFHFHSVEGGCRRRCSRPGQWHCRSVQGKLF